MYSSRVYCMKEGGGAFQEIDITDAPKKNQENLGIFWTVHEFDGARKQENIVQLNGFAVDIDSGTKAEQLARIKKGLYPTWLIESKRGFHVYWLFKEPMKVEFSEGLRLEYSHIVKERLVPFYNADPKAADLSRVLRIPYFYHCKEPLDKFLIKVVDENPVFYTWRTIERFFPAPSKKKVFEDQIKTIRKQIRIKNEDDVFNKVWYMDSKSALEQISGHAIVAGDKYSFKRNISGTFQIIVNGKSTSCWVDANKHIGSHDKGGPTIWQWLYWYCKDHKTVYKTMREVFFE